MGFWILAFWHFGILIFWHFIILTFWHFDNLAFWHFGILAFGHLDSITLWHNFSIQFTTSQPASQLLNPVNNFETWFTTSQPASYHPLEDRRHPLLNSGARSPRGATAQEGGAKRVEKLRTGLRSCEPGWEVADPAEKLCQNGKLTTCPQCPNARSQNKNTKMFLFCFDTTLLFMY